jgi:hypothetical protein
MKDFSKKQVKIIALFIFLFIFSMASFANAQNVVKTTNKSFIESVPGLKQIEAFRVKHYNQCQVKYMEYGKTISGKNANQIIDSTKRDLAYEATQKALPENLRQTNNVSGLSYEEPKNFVNYHANGICSKFLGSQFIYYGILILLLLVIIKSFSK